jgi:hypothetical protein
VSPVFDVERHRRRRIIGYPLCVRKAMWALLAAAVAAGGAAAWWFARATPEDPARVFFRRDLPKWVVDRAGGGASVHGAGERLIAAAAPWPGVQQSVRTLDEGWPDRARVREAAAALNKAARDAGLAFWVDVQIAWEKPVVLSYEVSGRALWKLAERSVEVLRARRLDTINVEMGLLGHAGGDQPVVLVDRLEVGVTRDLPEAYGEAPEGNAVDLAARRLYRRTVEARAGPGLRRAAEGLARRDDLFRTMEKRLHGGHVRVPHPERLFWGAEYFETLEPYSETTRRGGPLIFSSDLRDLRRSDEMLRDGDLRAALDAAVDLEAHLTEAHEARHALDPEPLPVPDALFDFVGDDDLNFAADAERELRAYVGEIHGTLAPACLSVQKIARTAAGERRRGTPHFYAGNVLLRAMEGAEEGRRVPMAELLEQLCEQPDRALRAQAARAYEKLYERPFVGAQREAR